jgi:hypothetical protein
MAHQSLRTILRPLASFENALSSVENLPTDHAEAVFFGEDRVSVEKAVKANVPDSPVVTESSRTGTLGV